MKANQSDPLKVLLIGNYTADQQQSMLGFAGAMLSGLCARGVDVRLLAPARIAGRVGQPHHGVGKWLGYVDKFGLFPPVLRRALAWADVVHICDQGNAMYVRHLQGKPHVLTCNDLLAIRAARGEMSGWTIGRSGRLYQTLILAGIQQAQHVVCISDTTRQDLIRIAPACANHASVVLEGLLSPYCPMTAVDSAALLQPLGVKSGEPFLLHVGGNQPYKNRQGVCQIFAALRAQHGVLPRRLVMAGKPLTADIREYIRQNNLQNDVLELTGLNNEQLRALYSRAQALVFPSLYEGFGLPIIEAQACGCPVFTSNRGPMSEVGGDAAVYFDPTLPAQAARVIAENLGRADAMREAGFRNVQRFTTERMIAEYIDTYQTLLRV